MNKMNGLAALALTIALAGCATDAPVSGVAVVSSETAAVASPTPVSATADVADLSAAAQIIANNFNSISGQNLGGGWQFDGAQAVGNRVELTIEVPVAGRNFRNFDRPGDQLRADLRRANCGHNTISAFLLLGGVMEVEIQGRDNVRIGTYTFDDPC